MDGQNTFSSSKFNLRTAITFSNHSSRTVALLLPLRSSRASDMLTSLAVWLSHFLTSDNFKWRQKDVVKLYINRLPHSTTISKQAYMQTQ